MTRIIKKQFILPLVILVLGLFFTSNANAATLANLSDTLSTSRPSASAPLAVAQTAGLTQAVVVDLPATLNNSALWLSSDSAVFNFDTGQTLNTVNVASMSAANTPAANQRILYLTGAITNAHHQGTAVFTPITATHTIRFTTSSGIPSGGHIIITFPGTGSTSASPSASTFAFNGLTSANASTFIQTNNATTCTWSVTAPSIDCQTSTSIAGGTTISFLIGCATQSSGTCTAFSPKLVNPTKGATVAGLADTWKVSIATTDTTGNGGTILDSGSVKIGIVEAVQVQGTIEPTLTFTITGRTDGTNINTISASCGSITTNAGIDSTATFVNLGIISNGKLSKAAQQLEVSTNGSSGYAITATSSGRFINPASGVWLGDANGGNGLTANDTPAPAVIPVAAPTVSAFGIHACGARSNINTDQWVNAGTAPDSSDGTAKFSNPWNTGTNGFYSTIASYTGGPVTQERTAVLYGATALGTTPAGIYSNYYTYVATATF
jgi:hypothetical protein